MEGIILKFEWPYDGHESETLTLEQAKEKFSDCFDSEEWGFDFDQNEEFFLMDRLSKSRAGDIITCQFTRVTVMEKGQEIKCIYKLIDGLEEGGLASEQDDLNCHIKDWTVCGFLFEELIQFLPEEKVSDFVSHFESKWKIREVKP